MMPAPWARELAYVPAWGHRLSEELFSQGFTLEHTRYMYAFFGSREVLFRHPHTKMWVRLWYDGREDDWCLQLSQAEGRQTPETWLWARHWAIWAGLTNPLAPEHQVNQIMADGISAVLAKAREGEPAEVMTEVSAALNPVAPGANQTGAA